MNDRVSPKYEQVQERILSAAREVFCKFGFAKTTLDDIARAVHKGKSTIYHYFADKTDLFRRVVQKESQLLRDEIARAVEAEERPEDKLRSYFITRMRVLHRVASLNSAIKEEYLDHYGFIEAIRREYIDGEVRMVRGILTSGVEKGVFEIQDVPLTAYAIITALKGLEYPWATQQDLANTEAGIDSLMGVLLRGILRR